MSGLFGRPKIVMQSPPPPPPPAPRDEDSREAAARMRRFGQRRGRLSTVLTRFTQRSASSAPVRTVIGGGG